MRVDAPRREDFAFSGNHLRARADDDGDAGLHVGVASLAYGSDPAVGDRDVRLDDPPMVQDQRIGDDGVDGALGLAALGLAHAVADHLATAEFDLLAIESEITLHLDEQLGIRQADAVAGRGPIHVGIGAAGESGHSAPMTSPRNP